MLLQAQLTGTIAAQNLTVRLFQQPRPRRDIHGVPRRYGFRYGAQLLSLFREDSMERRLAALLAADAVGYLTPAKFLTAS